ncbi:iron-containing alcohol dehydrogenase [Spirosoma foliorum]|uniref:Iron-containing alcohol dehydrogenase n=1 Tax=Spirosoma foliorum TaxID=2710596 RepID=A0A7G5H2A7_9BACT|nr:iron-containing alcohol dehydrogenase [Spirosoma foliorum]QMW05249.1 iron-containing alcohol dehydrogenase [Spirosoma foliorum]
MYTKLNFSLFVPTRIVFGVGEFNNLHSQPMPGKKALLLISKGKSTRQYGYLARTEAQLKQAGVDTVLFDQIEANPFKSTVMAASVLARQHQCDFIVALGGGSVIDASKAIAVMATNPGDFWDYILVGTGKGKPVEHKPLPIVAIPTTAGTGSEVDPWGAIINEETAEKVGFGIDDTYPVLAVIDPELTLSVPPAFTAYQGFDAMFHSIERYVSKTANALSDLITLKAVEIIAGHITQAVNQGDNLNARAQIGLGNLMSGLIMKLSSGISHHSLENAMTAFYPDLPHGAGLLILCEAYFTDMINKHVCDERFVQLARVMGMPKATQPMDFITALTQLMADCGVADLSMADYGISPDEFARFTLNARATMGGLFLADRTPLSDNDCVAIYTAAYHKLTHAN